MSFRKRIVNFFTGKHLYSSGGSISLELTKYKFADAIFLGILKKILEGLQNTEYYLIDGERVSPERKMLFNSFVNIFENQIEQVLIRYLQDGVVFFRRDFEDGTISLLDEKYKGKATHTIYSTSYKLYGKSDTQILREDFQHIDNILNAVSTSVKRMGALVILTPRDGNSLPVMMDEADIKEFEQDLAKDYGTLDSQSPVKIMRRSFDVSNISLAGATLRTNENLQTAVKIVCDVLEVPYELVSSAIVGNTNQTGVYQAEAVDRLYKTVEKYVSVFVKFASKELNLEIDYNISTAPQKELKKEWEAKSLVVETLEKAKASGLMDDTEAKEMFDVYFNLD